MVRKISVLFVFAFTVAGFGLYGTLARGESGFYSSAGCTNCHPSASTTCNGCHAHGVHSSSAKSNINITGTTNKTTYTQGETVSVTIAGGYRSGWVRAVLLDQNNVEVARSTGTAGGMGSSTTLPATLSAPAPVAVGSYTWKAAWYGNKNDTASASFGTQWVPDPANPNHGMQIVSTNSFTVVASADTTAPVVGAFSLAATSSSLTVPVASLTATDDVAVTGYLVTTSSSAPAATAAGWSATAPAGVTAAAAGSNTFYAWAKDAAGNVSLSRSATVVVTLPANAAPSISGTPAATGTPGTWYSFTPTASDPSNDPLTFSIVNKPSWATFSTAYGTLSGTPATEGSYSNIAISVSDGTTSVALPVFSIVVAAAVAPTPTGTPIIKGQTRVPVLEGFWLVPGVLAGVGLLARRRKG